MAKRNLDEAMQQYKSDLSSYFKLENDLDTSVVRFLHEGDDLEFDEDWFIVHKVQIDGSSRWVRCPETADCPACKRVGKPILKLFLQLVEKEDPERRKLWERGQTFIPQIRKKIADNGDLCNRPYEIERHGAAGSTKTTYDLHPLEEDDMTLEDIPMERQKLLNGKEGFILQLSVEEINDALNGRLSLRPQEQPREERRERRSERRSSEESGSGESKRGGKRGSTDIF